MKVVDTFIFSDELDMLECRLTELEDAANWFVLVEAESTFQGDPKPLYYDENRDRFARWSDRIVHVVVELPEGDPWMREDVQREAIIDGLRQLPLSPDDTIVLSDVDEIWRMDVDVAYLPRPFTVLTLDWYIHDFGWKHPKTWDGPVVCHVEDLPPADIGTFKALRCLARHDRPPRAGNAGWHLTWFGGDEAQRRKLESFSHTEYRDVDMRPLRAAGIHIDGTQLERVTEWNDLPRFVRGDWLP